MSDEEEKTGFWKNWMSIAVIIVVVIAVLWFNNYTAYSNLLPKEILANNKNVSIGDVINHAGISTGDKVNQANVSTDDNISNVDISTNGTSVIDRDVHFKDWIGVSLGLITENLNCISDAGKNKNFANLEKCGKFLSENSNMSLNNINEFNVSVPMQAAADEYKKALQDYNVGGTDIQIGAQNRDMLKMNDGAISITNGTARVNKVIDILNAINPAYALPSNAKYSHPKVDNASQLQ